MATTNRAPLNSTASLPKYMARRGSILYFKRRIPADVAEGFPSCSGQIWLSLGTHLVEKAKVLLAVEVTEFNLRVASLRRERALSFATAELAESPASQAHASSPLRATEKRLSRLASPSASLELLPARAATSLRPKQVPAKVKAAVPPKVIASARCASIDRPSMLHLFEDWKRKQDRPRTVGAVHTAVMEFRTLHGALPMEEITKAHARAYRDHLIERQLSKGTVENRLGFLATLVRHGMKEMVEHLTLNAFERIEVVGAQGLRKPKQRRAYEVHELNTLFASRLYTAGYRPDGQCVDVAYWAPLLGTFTGARIEELCQLRIDDVQCINGVWCIRICNLDEEQNIKTDSSFRRIPLHKVVVNSGFLVYAARMAKAGHVRLFPTLTNDNANAIYSNAVGKWYGRYLESIGLADHRLDFHSFRYAFKQRCSLCGIENEVRDALAGHWLSKSDSGRTYLQAENRQYPFPKLVAAIALLSYDELRVSHLFVEKPMEGVEALK